MMTTAEILALAGFTREQLGRRLRELWTQDAATRPDPKPSHLVPFDQLPAADREVDMRMAEELFALGWRARFAATPVRPCHCLCAVSHPQAGGICDGLNATVERTAQLRTFALSVQLCQPCADAADRWQASQPADVR